VRDRSGAGPLPPELMARIVQTINRAN